jgi:siroheme synthase
MAADTAVAIVQDGHTPAQRVVSGKLDGIAELATAQQVRSPAVIVIGAVAGFADGCG